MSSIGLRERWVTTYVGVGLEKRRVVPCICRSRMCLWERARGVIPPHVPPGVVGADDQGVGGVLRGLV